MKTSQQPKSSRQAISENFQSEGNPPRVLITGSTGMVGSYLYKSLSGKGLAVQGMARAISAEGTASHDIASDQMDWSALLQGVDTVIHCAGLASVPRHSSSAEKQRLYEVNRDATAKLARACLDHGVRRLLFTSTAKVYGDYSSMGSPFFEDDPLRPTDAYGESKRQAETNLLEFREKGLEVCILRLPMVYGPDLSANLQLLHRLVARGIPIPLGSVRNRRSVLGVNNLGVIVDRLLRLGYWRFPILNLADPEPVSTPELVRMIARTSSLPAKLVPFPLRILKPVAKLVGRESMFHSLASNLELHCANLYTLFPDLVLEPTASSLERLRGGLIRPDG